MLENLEAEQKRGEKAKLIVAKEEALAKVQWIIIILTFSYSYIVYKLAT